MVDLLKFFLNTIDGEDALQVEEARHLWNPIIKKCLEVEDRRLRQSAAASIREPLSGSYIIS